MSNPIVTLIKAEGKVSAEVEAAAEKCVMELSENHARHYMKMGKFKAEDIDKLVKPVAEKAAAKKKAEAEKKAAEMQAKLDARKKAKAEAPVPAPKAEAKAEPKKTKKSKK